MVALVGLLVFASSARAQLGPVRLGADAVDAPVTSIATNGARTLVAGEDLERVARSARGGAIVSALSGRPLALIGEVEDLQDVIPAPDGGWYAVAQDTVVRLRSDGSVDPAFVVKLLDERYPGDARSLALSPDGGTLYLGGFFDTVNGVPRKVLAAVDARTGAVRPWQASGVLFEPFDLVTHGNVVYAGGVAWDGAYPRTFVALDATTGTSLGLGPSGYESSFALEPDGRTLYVGIEGEGAIPNALVAVDTATFTERWRVITGDEPIGLALRGGRLYFTNAELVGGVARSGVAVVDAATGALLPVSVPQGAGKVLVSPDGSTLYSGSGSVPWSMTGSGIAASTSDGALLGWAPRGSGPSAMSLDGQRLLVERVGEHPRIGVAMLDETGSAVPWSDPTDVPWTQYVTDTALDTAGRAFVVRSNRTLYAVGPDGTPLWQHTADTEFGITLSPDGATLYLHGSFTQVDGVARSRVAAVRVSDGTLLPWAPAVSGGWVSAVAVHGSRVYLGGSFTSPRVRLAAVDAVTGAALPFTAAVDGNVNHLAVSPAGDTLYLGGQFEHVAGSAIENLAGVSTADGRLVFKPALNTNIQAFALVQGGRTLVVGSNFLYDDRHLSAWDTSTSAEVPWALGECYRCTISALALSPDGSTLQVGGEFRYGDVYAHVGTVAIDRPETGSPANVTPPSLWASAVQAGDWVTCDPGTWSGHPTEYRFAWRIGGAIVPGYDTRDLLLDATDVGKTVACEVRAVGATTSSAATSAPLAVAAGTSVLVPAPRRDAAPPPGGPTPTPTPTATATATRHGHADAPPATATVTPTATPTATATATRRRPRRRRPRPPPHPQRPPRPPRQRRLTRPRRPARPPLLA